MGDTKFYASAVVVSIILTAKMFSSTPQISMQHFQFFGISDLKEFEILFLTRIGFHITPQSSPTVFMRVLLYTWEAGMYSSSRTLL